MKRLAFLSLSVFFAAMASGAQTSYGTASAAPINGQQSTSTVVLPVPTACPASIHALQGSGTGLLAVRDQRYANQLAQRIHLILADGNSSQIETAMVRVRGLSGKNRISLADSSLEPQPDMTRTLKVVFSPESDTEVSTDLFLPGFTLVSSVELVSANYKDGTTWSVAPHTFCRVTPDRVMRIAGP